MSSHENDAWFSREIEKLGPTLFRVAFAILRNRTDCEDAAQNAVPVFQDLAHPDTEKRVLRHAQAPPAHPERGRAGGFEL